MVTPVQARIAENAQIECCTKCQSNCCLWRRRHQHGDISPISTNVLQEIEKATELYERKRKSIIHDSTFVAESITSASTIVP